MAIGCSADGNINSQHWPGDDNMGHAAVRIDDLTAIPTQ
jgi:hypothetical protein